LLKSPKILGAEITVCILSYPKNSSITPRSYRRRLQPSNCMKQLSVLHVEDSKEDSELIGELLTNAGLPCDITRVETRPEVFEALEKESFDLILADCKLPGFSGLGALEIAHALKPETPFVFVSGTIGEETAIDSLRNGATDYVLKDRLSRLVPAVRRALAEAEERMLCRQLQQRLHEAGRLEAISTLSNGIAHDFNNILTIILGHASLLTLQHKNSEYVLEISKTISEAARRGSDIVQQLLAFARKSDGHVALSDLNQFVRASLDVLGEKVPSQVEITLHLAENLPHILADASQVERILLNLVTNSIDAMSLQGRLTLSTQLVDTKDWPDIIPDLATGKFVLLTIEDTGRGIDPNTREHVFEPFFTTKERGRGTGLGLPVVYGLMMAHHGFVDVKSKPGSGTTVSLFFPVPQKEMAKSFSEETDTESKGSETILVVEDEVDVSFFLKTMLCSQGYHVFCAKDADEALKLFRENKDEIKLVLSDVGLPRTDGIVLCEKLKTIKPGIALILASGYPTKEFKTRLYQLAPEAFLSKPYSAHEILQTVYKVLHGAKVLHLAD
jgi:two-component system cell cycle sensor histidine kinase/response regulator CckA